MTLIDRRQFLRLFSAAFVIQAIGDKTFCNPSSSQFESSGLGLRFTVPKGWFFMDGITALKILDKQVLERPNPASIPATPLAFYSRYKEPCPQMNPSVGIFVDTWSSWMGTSVAIFARTFYEHSVFQFHDSERELVPEEIVLSGQLWQKSVLSFYFVGSSGSWF